MLQWAAFHNAVARKDNYSGSARNVKLQAQMLRFQNGLGHSWKGNALTIQWIHSTKKTKVLFNAWDIRGVACRREKMVKYLCLTANAWELAALVVAKIDAHGADLIQPLRVCIVILTDCLNTIINDFILNLLAIYACFKHSFSLPGKKLWVIFRGFLTFTLLWWQ